MKKWLLYLACVLLILGLAAAARADVAIDETNFPDAAFRQNILDRGYDADGNGSLSGEELENVAAINCANLGISDLTGIGHFSALHTLYCRGNALTALDLSGNPALETLSCGENRLISLNVSGNAELKQLECVGNQLTELDVGTCPLLSGLWCYQNQLTKLNVRGCGALEELYCDFNRLTALDLSTNTSLTGFVCIGNRIAELDVSACPTLGGLLDTEPHDMETYWTYGNPQSETAFLFDKTTRVICGDTVIEPTEPAADRVPGDADGNGETDMSDALCVLQHLCGQDSGMIEANANVNGDETVDTEDAVLILQYVCGWDAELL